MKLWNLVLTGLCCLLPFLAGAQNNSTFNLTTGDTVTVKVTARGSIQWERSTDSQQWDELPGETGSELTILADQPAEYRARISEQNCDPVYSSHTLIRIIPDEPGNNIVFILADDLGWKDLGCYGSDYYETPHLDGLARQGVRFTDAYSAHPVCSPTRASLATGKYPARLHITAYIPGQERPYAKLRHPEDWQKYLKLSETTYAEVLQQHGYKTFHAGKWHLGRIDPGYHGFDEYEADRYHSEGTDDPKNDLLYASAVIDFIEENRDSKFLAVLSLNSVHVPLEARGDLVAKYESKPAGSNGQDNALMGGMIESLDQSVGMLLDKLEELHLMEDTWIIFFSDNGGLASATSNKPLRGGKSQNYEGGIRVPFLVKGPRLPRNHTVTCPVISTDIFPTMLSMAGIDLMPDTHPDGLDLMPLLTGAERSLDREHLFFHYPHYQTLPPHGAVRSGKWKLVENYETGLIELFDLENDIAESKNLSETHPDKKTELWQLLHDHLDQIGARFPVANPDFDPAREDEKINGEHDPAEFDQPGYTGRQALQHEK